MSNPIKPNFKTEWFSVALIILSGMVGIYFYQHFPASVASHWNWRGEVDGYSSAVFAAFLFPALMLGMYLMFLVLPYLDPKKEEYANFVVVYHKFKNLMIAFLYILFIMTGVNGLGYRVDIGFWMPIMVGALFIIIGLLLKDVKSNWFMGIRTPWTLSSEEIWEKTHKASTSVMTLAGLLMAATVLAPPLKGKAILFIFSIILIVIGLPLYSYILFVKAKREKK